PTEHIDMLPLQTIKEFQEIFVYYIHKKLSKNHTRAGRSWGKKQLNYIFNDEHWSIKHYDQDQKTYIILLDQPNESCNFSEHNRIKIRETNPLAVLANQRVACKANIKKKSRYKRGEVVIEWKEKKEHEINDNFCYAGHITMNFYISQIRSLN
ncbi:hypothetical protein C1646_772721, partial [Rhizophagus diaphanus]